jgi:hypothetical protein
VEATWSQLASNEERVQFQTEVSAILDWARTMTLIGRAQTHQKLMQIVRRGAYLGVPRERRSVEIDL